MHASTLLALVASATLGSAGSIQGFNYASTNADNSARTQQDFESQFKQAAALAGTNGAFTSARLYTTIQAGTQADPISAIGAAVSTNTRLLLGMWASAGPAAIENEIKALQAAISQYGSKLGNLLDGISIGSEDLYRVTPTSQAHDPGLVGAGPADIVNYIGQLKKAIANTPLSGAKIGHVDTWTAWVNGSNSAVVDACDWIGMDTYPYFEDQKDNTLENSKGLFDDAWSATKGASKGKPVWVTETGWPTAGKTDGQAVPSVQAAQQYWEAVGCGELFGQVNTWWFTYFDGAPNPTFGLVESVGGQPKYDLSCSKKSSLGEGSASASGAGSGSASSTGAPSSGGSTSGGSNSGSGGSSSSSGSGSASPSSGGSSSSSSNGTAPSSGTSGVPPSPSSSSTGSAGSTGAKGAASTNGVCFLGLLGAALAAVALF